MITKSYIDIHSHLLPVQDGPSTMEEAISALNIASSSGIEKIIITPHFFSANDTYKQREIDEIFNKLKGIVDGLKISIKIYLGNELNIDEKVLECLAEGKARTLAGTDFILAEYPFYQVPCNYINILHELLDNGYTPIIAHPERNAFFIDHYEDIREMKAMGCKIQINAASLLGGYGTDAKKHAKRMLADGLVDFIASDSHSDIKGSPDVLHKAIIKAVKLAGDKISTIVSGGIFKELLD